MRETKPENNGKRKRNSPNLRQVGHNLNNLINFIPLRLFKKKSGERKACLLRKSALYTYPTLKTS